MKAQRVALVAILGLAFVFGLSSRQSARAQTPAPTAAPTPELAPAPTITLDRTAASPGERILVTLTGWQAQVVTVSVCGNLAKRGSVDCNMSASQAFGISRGEGNALAQMIVSGPPTTCPCVIRGASSTQDEVAMVPIELIGVPVGPLVDPISESLAEISLDTKRVSGGLMSAFRTALGGPTVYDVTVSLHNRSPELLPSISIWGSVSRSKTDELISFRLPPSGELAPGATWTRSEQVRLSAPVFGKYVWRVGSTGDISVGQVEKATSLFPKGLSALVIILFIDLGAMAWRMRARRKARKMAQANRSLNTVPSGPSTTTTQPRHAQGGDLVDSEDEPLIDLIEVRTGGPR